MMRARALMASAACAAVAASAVLFSSPASATNFTDVLDDPSYWQAGNQADIIQWINMSSGSSHPRYSTHRVDVLLDDGGKPLSGTTYLKLTTNFSAISGTTSQDEFVSAVKLPAGVQITETKQTPIFCRIAPNALFSDANIPFQLVADSTCRQGVTDVGGGVYAVNDKVLQRGDVWEVYVPVSSDRAIGLADSAAGVVTFAATHANQDATEPAVAEAINILTIGAPTASSGSVGTSAGARPKAGSQCSKAGTKFGGLTCKKVKGKLVWRSR